MQDWQWNFQSFLFSIFFLTTVVIYLAIIPIFSSEYPNTRAVQIFDISSTSKKSVTQLDNISRFISLGRQIKQSSITVSAAPAAASKQLPDGRLSRLLSYVSAPNGSANAGCGLRVLPENFTTTSKDITEEGHPTPRGPTLKALSRGENFALEL